MVCIRCSAERCKPLRSPTDCPAGVTCAFVDDGLTAEEAEAALPGVRISRGAEVQGTTRPQLERMCASSILHPQRLCQGGLDSKALDQVLCALSRDSI